jgi:hypothetical protein
MVLVDRVIVAVPPYNRRAASSSIASANLGSVAGGSAASMKARRLAIGIAAENPVPVPIETRQPASGSRSMKSGTPSPVRSRTADCVTAS